MDVSRVLGFVFGSRWNLTAIGPASLVSVVMRSSSKEYRYHSVTGEEMPSTLIESPVHLPAIFLSSAWTWAPESASGASLAPGSLLWARSGTLRSLPPQPQTGTVTIAAT